MVKLDVASTPSSMNPVFRGIEEEALRLPARLRARLARELIVSLDDTEETEADIEEAWLVETRRRSLELRNGTVKGIPAARVLKRARSALR